MLCHLQTILAMILSCNRTTAEFTLQNVTLNFLQDQEIQMMEWPAMSPHLNPIEHVWDILERRIRKRPAALLTLQELAEALIEEAWQNLPQDALRSVVRSMPRRCQAVFNVRGEHTRY
jgi:hypothetical protein